jgi:hypothetical protein
MAPRGKKLLTWVAVGALLLLTVNVLVAIRHAGTRAGRTYRWVCRESGAELSYTPGVFGSGRLTPGTAGRSETRWELVEPRPPSPLLPWNWLTTLVDQSAPDPGAVIRHESLGAGPPAAAR